jgi:uncharacterized protein (TIGR00369 family)
MAKESGGMRGERDGQREAGGRREVILESEYNACFGCGHKNPAGLRLTFYETDEEVEAEYTVPEQFAGPPGIAHGGIQAAILDETLCVAAFAKAGTQVVTGEMTIRYVRPVPTLTPILARARVVDRKDRSFFIEGEIYLTATGEELTRARGRFFAQDV